MGCSEWGFVVSNYNDIETIYRLVEAHNAHCDSEPLTVTCIIRHDSKLYLLAINGGGRNITSNFISRRYRGQIYYPFEKPEWWHECETYVWEATCETDRPPSSIFQMAPV